MSTGSQAAAPAMAAPAAAEVAWYRRIPAPWMFASLITVLLVVGEVSHDILGGYERLATALGVAIMSELVLSRLLRKRWPSMLSAYISGNSVSILVKPAAAILWPFSLGAFLAIASKYVLTYRGRHLWNPTNFSIGAMVLLAPGQMAILSHQWGNSAWVSALIYAIGLVVAWRARVLPVTITYLVAFAGFAALRTGADVALLRQELAPLTGAMYTLFVFFMITDPRTVVSSPRARILVCVLIALVDNLIRLLGDADVGWVAPLLVAPPIFALWFVGPAAMVVDLHLQSRRAPAPTAFP